MTDVKQKHIPVMFKRSTGESAPRDGGLYVDATFGNGGYSEAILKAASCRVLPSTEILTSKPERKNCKRFTATGLNSERTVRRFCRPYSGSRRRCRF